MSILVWAEDREWDGKPVKAGDRIPEMARADRTKLYIQKQAIREADWIASLPTIPAPADSLVGGSGTDSLVGGSGDDPREAPGAGV